METITTIIPTEQIVTVMMPVEQAVTVIMPSDEQAVTVVMPGKTQTITTVIPIEQDVCICVEEGFGTGDFIFSNFELSKNPILNKVIVEWYTNIATKGQIRSRLRGSGDSWNVTSLEISFKTSHTRTTEMSCTPGSQYEFQAFGINASNEYEWDTLRYVKISGSGEPEFEE